MSNFNEDLAQFILQARQATSWDPTTPPTELPGGGHQRTFIRAPWRFVDTWFGGEPFCGATRVFWEETAVWGLNYWGKVHKDADKSLVYACLAPALAKVEEKHPWRGPDCFTADNGLIYRTKQQGDLREFSGREIIHNAKSHWYYDAVFHGGLIDLQA